MNWFLPLKWTHSNKNMNWCQSQCMAKSKHGIVHIDWQSACLQVHTGLCLIPEWFPIALCDELPVFVAPILRGQLWRSVKSIFGTCIYWRNLLLTENGCSFFSSRRNRSLLSLLSFIFFPTSPFHWRMLSGDVCLGHHQGEVRVIWPKKTEDWCRCRAPTGHPTGWVSTMASTLKLEFLERPYKDSPELEEIPCQGVLMASQPVPSREWGNVHPLPCHVPDVKPEVTPKMKKLCFVYVSFHDSWHLHLQLPQFAASDIFNSMMFFYCHAIGCWKSPCA